MVLHLSYEIVTEQNIPGQAGRILRIELSCDGTALPETQEAISAWITTVTGEREALMREERHFADALDVDPEPGME